MVGASTELKLKRIQDPRRILFLSALGLPLSSVEFYFQNALRIKILSASGREKLCWAQLYSDTLSARHLNYDELIFSNKNSDELRILFWNPYELNFTSISANELKNTLDELKFAGVDL